MLAGRTLIGKADGFYLDHNESDAIYLDDIIFRELTTAEKEELNLQQYHGYVYLHAIYSFSVTKPLS
jgi:hypothetical protein